MLRCVRLCLAVALVIAVAAAGTPLGFAGTAWAQTDAELDNAGRQVEQLYQTGKYADGIPVAERYADMVKSRVGDEHVRYAEALSWLGAMNREKGNSKAAESAQLRALAIREKQLGSEDLAVAQSCNNLADRL